MSLPIEIPVSVTKVLPDPPSSVISSLMIPYQFALNEVRSTKRKANWYALEFAPSIDRFIKSKDPLKQGRQSRATRNSSALKRLVGTCASIEVPHGPVVETLMERDFKVYSINPMQLDRFSDCVSPAGAKDDRLDAQVLASSLRTDSQHFRHLDPPRQPMLS